MNMLWASLNHAEELADDWPSLTEKFGFFALKKNPIKKIIFASCYHPVTYWETQDIGALHR